MGDSSSRHQSEQKIDSIHDDRYGGMVALVKRGNKTYITKTISVGSQEQLNWMVSLSTDRAKLKHRNFCTVRNHQIDRKSDICSNNIVIRMYFDYYPNDLEKQINVRSQSRQHFTEEWIGTALYGLTECLRHLEENNCYQGDIKASNVLLDGACTPKLLDSYFTHFGRSNFQLVLSSPATLSYLSPQQLSSLRKGHYSKPQQNRVKNQVFSLGMTLMEAMVLENSFDCYEMNLLRLLENKVQERRKLMLNQYSQPLTELVISLLNLDENRRPSFTEILNSPIMKQYNTKISLSHSQPLQSSRVANLSNINVNKSAYQMT